MKRSSRGSELAGVVPPQASAHKNAAYWQSLDGGTYEVLIREREQSGALHYRQQEQFLRQFVEAEHDRRGRDLEVLEFGCGFGRHARYLAEIPGVRYHGYDFSSGMIAPLLAKPPAALMPIEERLFVGPSVTGCVKGRRFDLLFTVSVLIHNSPDQARSIVAQLAELVAPDGTLLFVENQLVPISVFENEWHEGCWLHAFADLLPDGWDLTVGRGFVDTHDVYLLRRSPGTRASLRTTSPGDAGEGVVVTRDALDALGLRKLKSWATGARLALPGRGSDGCIGSSRWEDLEERVRAQRVERRRHVLLSTLPDALADLRARNAVSKEKERKPSSSSQPAPAEPIQWNAAMDTRWAHRDSRFERVVNVFHQEWNGIRAMAGYLPGNKLAIPGERPLGPADHRRAIELVEASRPLAICFHGYSDNADALAVLLGRALGGRVPLCATWHGTPAQFHFEFELDMFSRLLERKRSGVLKSVACVKPGMSCISPQLHRETVLCMAPRVDPHSLRVREGLSGEVFIPVPNDWRKNFYTNLYGAALPRVRVVHVSAAFKLPAEPLPFKLARWSKPARTQVLSLMRACDAVMNVTLSECQPMTVLEGAAVGTPCLSGPLGLDEFEQHEFARLTRVRQVDSAAAVRWALDQVLDARDRDPRGLGEMMLDYEQLVRAEALERYGRLLHL